MSDRVINRIGFVGIGDIGFPIANRLLDSGYEVTAYDIDSDAMGRFTAAGGEAAANPAAVARRSQSVHIGVVNDEQLAAVVDGEEGVIAGFEDGGGDGIIVVHSTVRPETVVELDDRCPEAVAVLDAAVSGTRVRAKRGELSMMVGGDETVVGRYRPVLERIASDIYHMGGVGTGLTVKLTNNSILYASAAATLEAIEVGRAAGLDEEQMLEVYRNSTGDNFFVQNYEFFTHERAMTPAGPTAPIRNSRKTFIQYLNLTKELDIGVPMGAVASQQYPTMIKKVYRRLGLLTE